MTRPISPHLTLYRLRQAGDPQVSPEGESVLYTLASNNEEKQTPGSQVWLTDVRGEQHRQLTFAPEPSSGARWSPDGKRFAFVSSRVPKSGIFVMDAGGP